MKLDVNRIAERLKLMGYNKKTASEAIGLNRTWLYSVMRGAEPRAGNLRDLATLLDCDLAYLYGEQADPRLGNDLSHETVIRRQQRPVPSGLTNRNGVQLPVLGVVQAGAWLEVDELHQPSEHVMIDVDENFPTARKMIYDVRGDSMNQGGILEGDLIVCWDVFDYPFELRDGDDVVVERSRDAGMLRELTVKRLYRHPDGMQELRPISTNGNHKSLRIMPEDPDNGEVIKIVAVVEDIIRKHRRRVDG